MLTVLWEKVDFVYRCLKTTGKALGIRVGWKGFGIPILFCALSQSERDGKLVSITFRMSSSLGSG